MAEVASAYVSLIPSAKGFGRTLNGQIGPQVDRVGTSTGKRLGDGISKGVGGSVKKMLAPIAAGLATIGIGGFFKDAIAGASDLNEAGTKVEAIFGRVGTAYVNAFSKKGAKALGQTRLEVLNAASTFGTFGKAAGLSGSELANFSTGLAGLATDFSSFFNTSPETAVEAIGAALRGEAEPIRQFGILLDDASLKAEAMRLNLLKPTKDAAKIMASQARLIVAQQKYNDVVKKHGKDSLEATKAQAALGTAQNTLSKATQGTVGQLTQQQKILAAQSLIFKQSRDAQGDFKKTSGGLANQQRILSAQFTDLKTKLGQKLLPTAVRFVTFLNNRLIPGVAGVAKAFNSAGKAKPEGFLQESAVRLRKVVDVVKSGVPFVKAFFDGLINRNDHSYAGKLEGFAAAGVKVRDFLVKAKDDARAFFDGLLHGNTNWAGPLEKFATAGSKVRDALAALKDKGVAFWNWLKGDLFPALQQAAMDVFPSLQLAIAILKGDNSKGVGGLSFSFQTLGDFITKTAIPFLADLAKVWLPAVALNIRKAIDAVIAIHDAFITFKNGVSDAASFILRSFSKIASGFAVVLAGLATVPGFGWAAEAANTLQDAANKAGLLAAEIDGLNGKEATIKVNLKTQQGRLQVGAESVNVGMRARGGPVKAGSPYIVGEKRPELFVPNQNGKIIPKVPTGAAGGSGDGVNVRVGTVVAHDYDDFVRQMQARSRVASVLEY